MSIIYDALKKVEGKSVKVENKDSVLVKPKSNLSIYLISILVAVAGFFLANQGFEMFIKGPKDKVIKPARKDTKMPQPQFNFIAPEPEKTSSPTTNIIPATKENKLKENKKIEIPRFILNGTFLSGKEVYALINNQIVKEGDMIDGATGITIEQDKAKLKFNDIDIDLSVSSVAVTSERKRR
jgi:hypothetical protein